MDYTKDPAKMVIFFTDSREVVYGEIVLNGWNEPVEFVTDQDVTFTIVESQELYVDEYECKVTLDEENLNKLRKQYPKLYEKVKTQVKQDFYMSVMDDVMMYVKKEYPEIIGEEFEKLVDELFDELLKSYDFENRGVEELIDRVPLEVKIIRS